MFKDLFTFTVRQQFFPRTPNAGRLPRIERILHENVFSSLVNVFILHENAFLFASIFLLLEKSICNRDHYLVIVQRVWFRQLTQVSWLFGMLFWCFSCLFWCSSCFNVAFFIKKHIFVWLSLKRCFFPEAVSSCDI